ncbi:MAG: ABC transporter ATP-binding protein [Bacteroidales bacterium]|jgi:iron complex transport system ATP-binding protein|nr:ABC transporter ATP-binding protein [Bacteroidales bacterium]
MIEVKHLTYKTRNKKILLSDLNFEIKDGGFYGIIGNNGSGKTTLLRCLSNTLNIDGGSVFLNHKDITSYSIRQVAKQIAVVPQHTDFLFDFSAHQIVMMGRSPYQKRLCADSEQDLQIVEQSMRQTSTWHLRNTSVKVLSGGELQRVIIARALSQNTPLILLDEPVSNLDIKHQFEVMNLLSDINKEHKKTIIIVIHDLNLALKYTNHLLVIRDGCLIADKPTKEFLTSDNIKKVFNVNSSIIDNNQSQPYIIFQ